jgi:hypothetical protein
MELRRQLLRIAQLETEIQAAADRDDPVAIDVHLDEQVRAIAIVGGLAPPSSESASAIDRLLRAYARANDTARDVSLLDDYECERALEDAMEQAGLAEGALLRAMREPLRKENEARWAEEEARLPDRVAAQAALLQHLVGRMEQEHLLGIADLRTRLTLDRVGRQLHALARDPRTPDDVRALAESVEREIELSRDAGYVVTRTLRHAVTAMSTWSRTGAWN